MVEAKGVAVEFEPPGGRHDEGKPLPRPALVPSVVKRGI